MKAIILTIISSLVFVSCSHHSFDEISYYDVSTFKSSCLIATDIREDISGVHRRAYKDTLTIVEKYINEDSSGFSFEDALYLELSKDYPQETVSIITNRINEVYNDADGVSLETGLLITPLISVSAILENALTLSEIDIRPF